MDNQLETQLDNNQTNNQLANQGVPMSENNVQALAKEKISTDENIIKSSLGPNQKQVYGKSELLDSGIILRDFLQLGTGNMVADLGAGGGGFSMQSARLVGVQGQVYAVDILKNVLSEIESQARMANLSNIKTVWSNIEIIGATKINEQSLDAVLLVNVLFQSNKHYEIMSEAVRLLKDNGKLLVVDWSDSNSSFSPASERRVDPKSVMQYAQQLGLSLVKEFRAGNYHFGQIYKKA